MKILLPLFISLIFNFQALGQYTLIPDSNFEQALIDLGYDSGTIDGKVQTSSINTLNDLVVSNKGIKDLTGIQDFKKLVYLNCSGNELINLDVTNNSYLQILFCKYNGLNSLDISTNSGLTNIDCSFNNLAVLDCSSSPNLKRLDCASNNFHTLDLTNNKKLEELWCIYISTYPFQINLTQNTSLTRLVCGGAGLVNLDVTNNTELTFLSFSGSHINSIDLSQNTKLITLSATYSNLKQLDISKNTRLQTLSCRNNQLQNLNLMNNSYLKSINIKNNPIQDIDLSDKHFLAYFNCVNTPIECLNIGISESISTKIRIRAKETPHLYCIDIGKIKRKWFTFIDTDSNVVISNNCLNKCSSPLDTTLLNNANISIYPNPSGGNVTVSFNREVVNELQVVLVNAIGQEMWSQKLFDVSEYSFEIKGSSGLYFLQLIADSNDPIIYKILKN